MVRKVDFHRGPGRRRWHSLLAVTVLAAAAGAGLTAAPAAAHSTEAVPAQGDSSPTATAKTGAPRSAGTRAAKPKATASPSASASASPAAPSTTASPSAASAPQAGAAGAPQAAAASQPQARASEPQGGANDVPSDPISPVATGGAGTLHVEWGNTSENVDYYAWAEPVDDTTTSPTLCQGAPTDSSCDMEAPASATYDVLVWAVSKADGVSRSTEVDAGRVDVDVAAPTSATASVVGTSIEMDIEPVFQRRAQVRGDISPVGDPTAISVCNPGLFGTHCTSDSLAPGSYDVTAVAYSQDGPRDASTTATESPLLIPVGAPESVDASVVDGAIQVTFEDTQPGVSFAAEAVNVDDKDISASCEMPVSSPCDITGLPPGDYDVSVWAYETADESNESEHIDAAGNPVTIGLPMPTSVIATVVGATIAVVVDGDNSGYDYHVQARQDGEPVDECIASETSPDSVVAAGGYLVACHLGPLAPGEYEVVAWAEDPDSDSQSDLVTADGSPISMGIAEPTDTSATGGTGKITVDWTETGQPGVTYRADAIPHTGTVDCATTSCDSGTVAASCTTSGCDLAPLDPGEYDVRVYAISDDTPSDGVTVPDGPFTVTAPAGPPSAPREVLGVASGSTIVVSWLAPEDLGSGVTGYSAVATAPAYRQLTCAPTTELTCTLAKAAAGVKYQLSVVAASADGNSPAGTGTAIGSATGGVQLPLTVPSNSIQLLKSNSITINSMVTAGQKLTLTGNGYALGSKILVGIYSDPVDLGSVTSADGSFSVEVTVPAGLMGSHTLLATGVTPEGEVRTLSLPVVIAEASAVTTVADSTLAVTGAPAGRLALAALALILTGVATLTLPYAPTPLGWARRARRRFAGR